MLNLIELMLFSDSSEKMEVYIYVIYIRFIWYRKEGGSGTLWFWRFLSRARPKKGWETLL